MIRRLIWLVLGIGLGVGLGVSAALWVVRSLRETAPSRILREVRAAVGEGREAMRERERELHEHLGGAARGAR